MLAALAQWLALGLAGVVLGRAIPVTAGRPALRWVGGLLVALFVSSWVLFLLNQFAGVSVTVTAQLLVAAAIAGCGLMLRPRAFEPLPPAPPPPGRVELVVAAAVVSAFVITSSEALLRPCADFDAFMYHLPLARELLGGDFPRHLGRSALGNLESAYPPHLYYLYSLSVRGSPVPSWPGIAKVVQLGIHVISCAYLWALARDRFAISRLGALVLMLFFALRFPIASDEEDATPVLQMASVQYLFAALYHGWDGWLGEGQASRRAAVWGGVLLAGAYWGNYAVLPFAAALFGAAGLERWRAGRLRGQLAPLGIAAAIFAVVIAVHFLRNQLVIGNPLYPAFWPLLGGNDITPWFLANRHLNASPVPVALATLHRAFFIGPPVMVPIAGLLCLALGRPPRATFLAVIIAGYFAAWLLTLQFYGVYTWRYLVPIWGLSALAIALSIAALPEGRKSWAVALVLTLHPIAHALRLLQPDWPVFWAGAAALGALAMGLRAASARWPVPADRFVAAGGLTIIYVHFLATSLAFEPWVRLGLALLFVGLVAINAPLLSRVPPPRWSRSVAAVAALALTLLVSVDPRRIRSLLDDEIMRLDVGWLNANLREGERVLMYEAYTLPITVPWLAADGLEAEPVLSAEDDASALAAMRAAGVTHVWFSRRFLWPAFDEGLRQRVERFSERVYQRRAAAIYRLPTPSSSTPRPRRARLESRPRDWSSPSR